MNNKKPVSDLKSFEKPAIFRLLFYSILLVGTALRLREFFSFHSLTTDEAYLALNVIRRSWSNLLHLNGQVCPLGVVFFTKIGISLFGDKEFVFRILPTLCSLAALPLIGIIGTRFLGPAGGLISMALLALDPTAVHYSDNIKQYSSDLFISLLLVWSFVHFVWESPQKIWWFQALSAIFVWFSFPSIFILCGLGFFQLGTSIKWNKNAAMAVLKTLWPGILCFGLYYGLVLRNDSQTLFMKDYWTTYYLSIPTSMESLRRLMVLFQSVFQIPVDPFPPRAGMILFLLGCGTAVFSKPDRRWFLGAPLMVLFTVFFFHKYPFHGRLLIFSIPFFIFPMAAGLGSIWGRLGKSPVLAAMVLGIIFFFPLQHSLARFSHPVGDEELSPVFDYWKQHHQTGDATYLYYGAKAGFQYYAHLRGSPDKTPVKGSTSRSNPAGYGDQLKSFLGQPRVWILFSHIATLPNKVNEEAFLLSYLDAQGTRLDEFHQPGAAAYLFNLASKPQASE